MSTIIVTQPAPPHPLPVRLRSKLALATIAILATAAHSWHRLRIKRLIYRTRWQCWQIERTLALWRFWLGWRYVYTAHGLIDWIPGTAVLLAVWMLLTLYTLLMR